MAESAAAPLNSALDPLCSLGLYGGRVSGSVVGRAFELATIERELARAHDSMVCITAEGEPGIGKTRLLLAVEALAKAQGFLPIAVTADEEIRGPFLLARSIFSSPAALEISEGTRAEQAWQRIVDALADRDDPGLESLAPDRKLLRIFDLAAMAVRTLAAVRPLALLIDDLQWADEDSLRMLRYIVRVDAASPVLLVLAMRHVDTAFVNEAVTLIADIDRMGLLSRLKLGRFSQLESAEFLQQALGGKIDPASAAVMHGQAEGVPYILAEQAYAYRDAGLIQQVDGVWTLARNAQRLLPSAVKTLIQRRAAHLPDETKASLAEAAVLGRSFSLRDLHDVKVRLKDENCEASLLADSLAPAVEAGLLVQHPPGSPADYSFTHGQIREYATASLTPPRLRAVHAAIVDMLMGSGDPSPASLPLIAQHAMAAGQAELCARVSMEAARAALKAHAPEEVLRLVALAHPITSTPQDRVALLSLQDDALDMLRRPTQRLEGLAELAALAEALGDSRLELDVMLRRAAAFRLSQERDTAAEIARRVRQLAAEHGDKDAELAACLELGQDLLRSEIGEGYVQAQSEADLDGAEEAYIRAAEIAEELGNEAQMAAAFREIGIIKVSRVRVWFVAAIVAGEHIGYMRRIANGETLQDILPTLPVAPLAMEAYDLFQRALNIYERLGDRQGAMSAILAIAYISWGPEIHLPGSAARIEEIRRLTMRLKSLTTESERALADAQMLFGAHVYARAKVFPDVALAKGSEAYMAARTLGDRSLEFALTGSMALAHAELEDLDEAEQWLDKAAAIATNEPTRLRALRLEQWRGAVRAAARDVQGMRSHLIKAIDLATEQGRPSARCEALALCAQEAARLGAELGDEQLLGQAELHAQQAKGLMPIFSGHALWGAQANMALARVAAARGDPQKAAEFGRAALADLEGAMHEDLNLNILLPAAAAVLEVAGEEEAQALRDHLSLVLSLLAQRILDEEVRIRWFRSPLGRELTRLAGAQPAPVASNEAAKDAGISLAESDTRLLRLLTEGRTNNEIADELGTSEDAISKQLAELFVRIGASSRADATAVALMGKLV